jgi:hypothetical protein
MRSFDVYDTLITRLVADPADIFSLIEERLGIANFRSLRIHAEERARMLHGGEVRFVQIYQELDLPKAQRERACLLEYELESKLVSLIEENAAEFRNGDLVVSDMYHDTQFIDDLLSRVMPNKKPAKIFVSSDAGVNKAQGGLWREVAKQYPGHRSHIGDSLLADIKQARKRGLIASHYRGATLNRYELGLQRTGLDGSMVAAASRAARLSLINRNSGQEEIATIEAFTSVFAPLLYAFSEWILERCEANGLTDAYFFARDGCVPFKICSRLVAMRNGALKCHYIYASRNALHLPGFTTVDAAESWLLENTPTLTLRMIAQRAGIPVDVVMMAAKGLVDMPPDKSIPEALRKQLSLVIRQQCFVTAIEQASAKLSDAAIAYYRATGIARSERCAVVDIGWNGRMQSSLRGLLQKAGVGPEKIFGMYLCLSRRVGQDPRDSLQGYLCEPGTENARQLGYDRYRPVLEAAFSADHPTTLGFESHHGTSSPVFGQAHNKSMIERISLQHSCVDVFMDKVCAMEKNICRPIRVTKAQIAANLLLFLTYPSRRDGSAFLDFEFATGQTEDSVGVITKRLKWRHLKLNSKATYWREGTLSVSGLRGVLPLRKWLINHGRGSNLFRIMCRQSKFERHKADKLPKDLG